MNFNLEIVPSENIGFYEGGELLETQRPCNVEWLLDEIGDERPYRIKSGCT